MTFTLTKGEYLPPDAALALLGGQPPVSPDLLACVKQAGFVAAADGGAAIALQQGRCPDLLAGDFDSLPAAMLAEAEAAGGEIIRLPVRKDQTDGEFLLNHLAATGWRRLLILGALGGRVEQELANLLTAVPLAKQGVAICLADDTELLFLLGAGEQKRCLHLQGFAGCTVSLVALGGACRRVELDGFAYPLQGELAAYTSLGISNVAEAEQAAITLQDGCLLVAINL